MAKTLLYRLFGVGKISWQLSSTLKVEGIVLLDEGISGSVTYLNFRAPGNIPAGGGCGSRAPSL
jgi:hypothetical protein